MAHNRVSVQTIPDQLFPVANAPVWTIPSDAKPNVDMFNTAPSRDEYSQPSAPDPNELPPNYFDISIVPNNAVLHYNQVVPYTEPSRATVRRTKDGVLTLDSLVDSNPDQLRLYFMTYLNERPSLNMDIHGYHIEHYKTRESVRSADGKYHERTVDRTRDVTDFEFSFDLTEYVCPEWGRVAVIPSKEAIKKGEMVSLRDVMEQYTRSEKSMKNIECTKQLLGWNFEELSNKVKAFIHSTGYHSNISVTFAVQNTHIAARSSSKVSRFANSTLVRVLCVLSCLWIIFGPIYLCLRAAGSTRDRIVADYGMLSTAHAFFQLHAIMITNAVVSRSKGCTHQAILP